ncbi:adenylyl cyclase-associated protein (macronuclear) [Tetrahymena thermophila SB210]|uniref:Adenylyl cyclase-associated protein n=1 Tax=Tetrahymena thermophila (strain SB210) TaxID=312017 RepID=Q24I68_TETTS|nr:adenylyl cyclase-associated protein [Tetrahymena thermophila SB210]EAS07370.2 adenylyl cyclase-associated protein [Tetrahymena thermophila SB210]|eukprot:XP_001027612.2 adenylyl cyclase-associated protein [Tetrahymena thermophila SB210]
MSQIVQIQELIEQLVSVSQKQHLQPELNVIIEQLSQTVLHRSQQRRKKSVCYSFADMIEFDRALVNFEAVSEQLGDLDVAKLTQTTLIIFEMMKMIMEQAATTKKPFQNQVQSVNQILNNKIQSISKNFPNHLAHTKTIQDGLSSVYWVFSENPKTSIDTAIENTAYGYNKLKQHGNELLSQWGAYFNKALKALSDYVQQHYAHGLIWNSKGEGDFSELVSHLRAEIRVTLDRQLVDLSQNPDTVTPLQQKPSQSQPTQVKETSQQTQVQAQTQLPPPPQPVQQQQPTVVEPVIQQQQQPQAPVQVQAPVIQQTQAPSVQPQVHAQKQQFQSHYPTMTEFDQHVKDYLSAGEKLDSELQELTQLTVKAFEQMKIVMQFSKYLKKPQQDNIKQISSILNDKVFKPINSAKAGIKYPNHLKTVIQGISAVNWVICDTPKIYIDNGIESSEFYGNKILLMKVPEHTAWNNAFKAVLKSLLPYVLTNYSTGLLWNFQGTDDYSELYSVLKGEKQLEDVIASKSGAQQTQSHVPVLQSAPQPQSDAYPPMTEFEKHLSDFKAAYQNLDPLIKELSDFIVQSFESMQTVMTFAKKLKKPQPENVKQIQTILNDKIFKPMNASKAGISFPNHFKTALQGISAVLWVISETPKLSLDNGIESSEFYGNKILLMKQPEHTAWYNTFKASLKSLVPYVLMNFSTGLLWNFHGTDDYSELYSILKGEKKVEQPTQVTNIPPPPIGMPPPPPPPMLNIEQIKLEDFKGSNEESGESRTALLSALNVGEDAIKAHLKHVKKGEKYEKKSTQAPTNAAPSSNTIKKETQQQVKEPKKYQKDNWFVENYVNERIQFDEGEISLKQSLFIEGCNNSTIIVKGKVKSVFVNKCKKTKVLVTVIIIYQYRSIIINIIIQIKRMQYLVLKQLIANLVKFILLKEFLLYKLTRVTQSVLSFQRARFAILSLQRVAVLMLLMLLMKKEIWRKTHLYLNNSQQNGTAIKILLLLQLQTHSYDQNILYNLKYQNKNLVCFHFKFYSSCFLLQKSILIQLIILQIIQNFHLIIRLSSKYFIKFINLIKILFFQLNIYLQKYILKFYHLRKKKQKYNYAVQFAQVWLLLGLLSIQNKTQQNLKLFFQKKEIYKNTKFF